MTLLLNHWFHGCIRDPNFQFLLIGGLTVEWSKGIWQGEPLSPFLFLLVIGVLSALTSGIYEIEAFKGFVVGKDKVHLSNFQPTDDALLFSKFTN